MKFQAIQRYFLSSEKNERNMVCQMIFVKKETSYTTQTMFSQTNLSLSINKISGSPNFSHNLLASEPKPFRELPVSKFSKGLQK